MSADSAPKAQALKEAKRKEIRLERKRKGSVWTLYDGQVAALCRVKRHRLELAQGEVTSDIDRIDSIIANMRISRTPRKADKLGEQIELTDAERTALNIRAIAPCDLGKGERAERAVKGKREREKHRRDFDRRAAGKPTRAISRSSSLKATKPWKAAGVSVLPGSGTVRLLVRPIPSIHRHGSSLMTWHRIRSSKTIFHRGFLPQRLR
jgi:hypothetical protein